MGSTDKLFEPVPKTEADEDGISEDLINKMRKAKVKECEREKAKREFFRTVLTEEEKGNKVRRKWNQTVGSKAFYYNSSG